MTRTLPTVFRLVICDLDGTLVDSDRALADAFVAMGVRREDVTYGHVVAEECARLGIDPDEWAAAFDARGTEPFPGVDDAVRQLDRWAVCSNRLRHSGEDDLRRFGWEPQVALFADAFAGAKTPVPILTALGVDPAEAVFVGDTDHDRHCARAAGVAFALAAWNPRAVATPGDIVLTEPAQLVELAQSAAGSDSTT